MAKATELKAAPNGKPRGVFHVENFSLFEPADMEKYAVFRNRANDIAEGIQIELMREYSRKTVVNETMESGGTVSTTTEEIILSVHYWAKVPARTRGATDENDAQEQRALAR